MRGLCVKGEDSQTACLFSTSVLLSHPVSAGLVFNGVGPRRCRGRTGFSTSSSVLATRSKDGRCVRRDPDSRRSLLCTEARREVIHRQARDTHALKERVPSDSAVSWRMACGRGNRRANAISFPFLSDFFVEQCTNEELHQNDSTHSADLHFTGQTRPQRRPLISINLKP